MTTSKICASIPNAWKNSKKTLGFPYPSQPVQLCHCLKRSKFLISPKSARNSSKLQNTLKKSERKLSRFTTDEKKRRKSAKNFWHWKHNNRWKNERNEKKNASCKWLKSYRKWKRRKLKSMRKNIWNLSNTKSKCENWKLRITSMMCWSMSMSRRFYCRICKGRIRSEIRSRVCIGRFERMSWMTMRGIIRRWSEIRISRKGWFERSGTQKSVMEFRTRINTRANSWITT